MPSFLMKGLLTSVYCGGSQPVALSDKSEVGCRGLPWPNKKWLFFDKLLLHDFIDIVGPLNRILTAAINAFRPPLVCTDESDAEIARGMLRKAECQKNALFGKIEKGPFSSSGNGFL